jgi:hypothetical protein
MGVGEVKVSAETKEVLFLAPLPDKRRQIDLRQLYALMGQLRDGHDSDDRTPVLLSVLLHR